MQAFFCSLLFAFFWPLMSSGFSSPPAWCWAVLLVCSQPGAALGAVAAGGRIASSAPTLRQRPLSAGGGSRERRRESSLSTRRAALSPLVQGAGPCGRPSSRCCCWACAPPAFFFFLRFFVVHHPRLIELDRDDWLMIISCVFLASSYGGCTAVFGGSAETGPRGPSPASHFTRAPVPRGGRPCPFAGSTARAAAAKPPAPTRELGAAAGSPGRVLPGARWPTR